MKRLVKKGVSLGLLCFLFLMTTGVVFANNPLGEFNLQPTGQFGPLADISLPQMVRSLLSLAMVIAAIVAFAFLIFGGITWITSGGDKQKTESARNTITAALVGLLIVFGSWAIIQLIQMFFNVSILQLNLEPFTAHS